MKLLFENWRKYITESKLRVFDFDDTLAKSDSKIHITTDTGEKIVMTPAEYATHTQNANYEYDFSEFSQVINPREIKQITNINPVVNNKENQILGSVIYIDNYGNVVTNINRKFFNEIGKSRDYKIFARTVKFENIYDSYTDAIDFSSPKEKREEDGKKIAIFNSANHLELGIYKSNPKTYGSAASLFGLDYRDPITVKFE